jgi:hypothetical protein
VLLALVLPSPALTPDSLANSIQAQSPQASNAICNKSTQLDGAYSCTVDFPGCSRAPQASTNGPSCTPPEREVFRVNTEGSCWDATLIKKLENGQPVSTVPNGKFKRFLIRSGCIKG